MWITMVVVMTNVLMIMMMLSKLWQQFDDNNDNPVFIVMKMIFISFRCTRLRRALPRSRRRCLASR